MALSARAGVYIAGMSVPGESGAAESVVVPYGELAAELLHSVVESYVLREGTDYGEREYSLKDKVAHVIARLKGGEAQIVFDPQSQSVSIVAVPRAG